MQKDMTARLANRAAARSNALWFRKLSRAFGFDEAREMVRALTRCGSADTKAIRGLRVFAPMLLLALITINALRAIALVAHCVSPPLPPAADGIRLEITPRLLPLPAACRA